MTYKIEFSSNYICGPKVEVVEFNFFSDSAGYGYLDRAAITALAAGASLQLDDGQQIVTRLS